MTQDHWVYLCYDADDRLLYVGMTSRGFRRLGHEHARRASWGTDVVRIDVEHRPTLEAALALEQLHIGELQPLYNIRRYAAPASYSIPAGDVPTNWLSIHDLADWLSVEPVWVEARVKQGMPHAVIADNVRFRAERVCAWLRKLG